VSRPPGLHYTLQQAGRAITPVGPGLLPPRHSAHFTVRGGGGGVSCGVGEGLFEPGPVFRRCLCPITSIIGRNIAASPGGVLTTPLPHRRQISPLLEKPPFSFPYSPSSPLSWEPPDPAAPSPAPGRNCATHHRRPLPCPTVAILCRYVELLPLQNNLSNSNTQNTLCISSFATIFISS
jgi:hypothetical protein